MSRSGHLISSTKTDAELLPIDPLVTGRTSIGSYRRAQLFDNLILRVYFLRAYLVARIKRLVPISLLLNVVSDYRLASFFHR